jgi:hypothetical protein
VLGAKLQKLCLSGVFKAFTTSVGASSIRTITRASGLRKKNKCFWSLFKKEGIIGKILQLY